MLIYDRLESIHGEEKAGVESIDAIISKTIMQIDIEDRLVSRVGSLIKSRFT